MHVRINSVRTRTRTSANAVFPRVHNLHIISSRHTGMDAVRRLGPGAVQILAPCLKPLVHESYLAERKLDYSLLECDAV